MNVELSFSELDLISRLARFCRFNGKFPESKTAQGVNPMDIGNLLDKVTEIKAANGKRVVYFSPISIELGTVFWDSCQKYEVVSVSTKVDGCTSIESHRVA